jgi:hypothetical protein
MRVRICSLLLFLSTWDVDVVVENFYTFRLILYTSSSPGTGPPPHSFSPLTGAVQAIHQRRYEGHGPGRRVLATSGEDI